MSTFGDTSTTTTSGTATANNRYGGRFQFTGGSNCWAVSLSAYLSNDGAGTGHAKLGIYGQASSTLDSAMPRLGQCTSPVITLAAGAGHQWCTLNLDAPFLLVNNYYYWIQALVDYAIEIHRTTTGGSHCYQGDTYSDNFESTIGTPGGSGAYSYRMYCTYWKRGRYHQFNMQ